MGTGHAVQQVLPSIPDEDDVLILYGDVPLITEESLNALIEAEKENGFSLLTAYLDDPRGYGRIVRGQIDNIKNDTLKKLLTSWPDRVKFWNEF